ncbi:calcium-binding protein [Inquilinus sp. NPDC058860]|uniref:calcium-binding protein n=1 Tax=Inquilinus sp. NPDC058860 TaxID=3346652 RepID=UPI00369B41E7
MAISNDLKKVLGIQNEFYGTSARDIITGTDGNDYIEAKSGGSGAWGGPFAGGNNYEFLNGNGGNDTIGYSESSGAVTIDLSKPEAFYQGESWLHWFANNTLGVVWRGVEALGHTVFSFGGVNEWDKVFVDNNYFAIHATGGDAEGTDGKDVDVAIGFENVAGSNHDDSLTGDETNNKLAGLDGKDILSGGDGDDLLIGGVGADQLDGGAGIDTASYFDSANGVSVNLATGHGTSGTATGDTLISIESVQGSAYADTLVGNSVANHISGGAGDDTLRGGAGADYLNGGTGFDTANYSDSAEDVSVNLATGHGTSGTATGDTLISIEGVQGSAYADTLIGNSAANHIGGGAGDDTLRGGAGADHLDGGAGFDTVTYFDSPKGVSVNLATGHGTSGTAYNDTLISIEGVRGSGYNDTLIGNSAANTLFGSYGKDALTGGAGGDRFIFESARDTAVGFKNADRITDFNSAQGDVIDLSKIDENGSNDIGNGNFNFIGTGAYTKHAGELRYDVVGHDVVIGGDINGDGVSDFNIVLSDVASLKFSDFVL